MITTVDNIAENKEEVLVVDSDLLPAGSLNFKAIEVKPVHMGGVYDFTQPFSTPPADPPKI